MKLFRLKFISLFVFAFVAFLFLYAAPRLTKPANATANCPTSQSDNCATNLQVTSQGCVNNKVTVKFTWTQEQTPYTPTQQILDWAVTSNIDSVVNNPSYWGNKVVTGSTTTISGLFAPNINYWWRINTDWSSLGFGNIWSPSVTSAPFNFSCTVSIGSCTYSFPNSVATGTNFSVTVSGIAGDFYTAAIINTSNNSVVSQNTNQNASGPVTSINLTAPAAGNNASYAILANGNSITNGNYACTSSNTTLTVTGAGAGGASCIVNPTSTVAGQTFNVGGLNFDQVNPLHSVSITGYYPAPNNTFTDLALMSFDPPTGAWTATVTVPTTAPSGTYVVRVDSTQCYPNLDVTATTDPTSGLSCSYDRATASQLDPINITHKGFAAGESIRFFGTNSWGGLAKISEDSQIAPKTQLTSIPVVIPDGTYNIIIVTRFPVTATVCTGGPLVISATTTSTDACKNLLQCIGIGGGTTKFSASNLVGEIFTKMIPIVLGIAGMITVAMIVFSGFQFVTSSGNPEAAVNARSRLTYALIGFAFVALAFALTQIIDIIFLHKSGIFG